MILLIFSHPITNEQESQIKRKLGLDVTGEQLDTVKIVCQMDVNEPFDI